MRVLSGVFGCCGWKVEVESCNECIEVYVKEVVDLVDVNEVEQYVLFVVVEEQEFDDVDEQVDDIEGVCEELCCGFGLGVGEQEECCCYQMNEVVSVVCDEEVVWFDYGVWNEFGDVGEEECDGQNVCVEDV